MPIGKDSRLLFLSVVVRRQNLAMGLTGWSTVTRSIKDGLSLTYDWTRKKGRLSTPRAPSRPVERSEPSSQEAFAVHLFLDVSRPGLQEVAARHHADYPGAMERRKGDAAIFLAPMAAPLSSAALVAAAYARIVAAAPCVLAGRVAKPAATHQRRPQCLQLGPGVRHVARTSTKAPAGSSKDFRRKCQAAW
jgi:hypothetical protein